ncbi:sirohydrochlorin chelatase [Demequina muriae]|uniref:CbiX/SirB N-terminal domain-containing protein n=1 Tax=Demequina muriae TaxID=3051664 RepID=A0ABT8GIZ8_9MICO|nr:CbiX/SirB N-terminal domain-containing protein [Demequina sp. EGI L300058]MDN4481400.1 CbiX/SirB N-terminal domain-containing protein [Demequina sp. EGI L300058]
MSAILIGCAHGTRADEGQQTVRDLLDAVRDSMGVEVREAYVDVQDPKIDLVIEGVEPGDGVSAVVVPILLAGGYHVYVDIAEAVEGRTDIRSVGALGPDPRLLEIVRERLDDQGVPHDATVVLAAAGSSDPRSQADTERAAEMLREHWDGPVRIGFAAGTKPSVADAVASARENGEDGVVAVASYLLAPGLFQRRLHEAGADFVTEPLAPHHFLLEIIADRFHDALSA